MSDSPLRVKAVIAYDGSAYLGFQQQKTTKQTITYDLQKALASLHIHSAIVGSGRTDAGVHASGQVIHFDIPDFWHDLKKLQFNLNRKLKYIQIKHITCVTSDFHARFSAKKRIYRYVFKPLTPSVFEQQYISYYEPFNTDILQKALNCFIGEHDFDFFRKTGTETHTSIREIYSAKYVQRGAYHYLYFEANGFLRSQVRMMTDAAMKVAQGRLTFEALQEQLACIQKHTTKLAPPQGLYLARIIY